MKILVKLLLVAAFFGVMLATGGKPVSLPNETACYAGNVRGENKAFTLHSGGVLDFEGNETAFKGYRQKDNTFLVVPDREFYIFRYGGLELAGHDGNADGFKLAEDLSHAELQDVTGPVSFSRVPCT